MFLPHIFRSLVPLRNPIGFGLSDLLILDLTLLGLIGIFAHAWLRDWFTRAAQRAPWCMLALFLLPVTLRLALLPVAPAPAPTTPLDFSSLLLSDTLLHGRLANPPHPFPEFFETPLVKQQPTYRSTLPFWDGLLPAAGMLLFRSYWAGILLGIGALPALLYWMLRGWITAAWALSAGLLAALVFGPLCYWTNSYWGGLITLLAACALSGALPRLLRFTARPIKIPSKVVFVALLVYCAHFLFWYGIYAFAPPSTLAAVLPFGKDFLNNRDQQAHRSVIQNLNAQHGQQLVFVRRGPLQASGEWIHNGAEIDASKIICARDLGESANRKLLEYYPNRTAWLLEPDAIPPRLRLYTPNTILFENIQ